MKSNRAVGNAFEQQLCEMLFEYGFWVHNLKQDNSGQPADVIAARNKVLVGVRVPPVIVMILWVECEHEPLSISIILRRSLKSVGAISAKAFTCTGFNHQNKRLNISDVCV